MAQSISFGAYTIHIDGGKLTVLDHNGQVVATADLTGDAMAKIALPNGQVLDMSQLADALTSDHIADFATAAGGAAAGGTGGSGMFFSDAHAHGLGGFDEMQVIKASPETPGTALSTEDQQPTFFPATFSALQSTPAGESTPPPSNDQLPVDNTPGHHLPDDTPPVDVHPVNNGGGNDNQGGGAQGGSHASDNGGGNDNQGDNSQGGSHASDNGGGNDNQGDNSQGASHASDNGGGNDNQGDNAQGASHASDNGGGNDNQGDNSQGASHASDNGGGNDDQGDNAQGGSHASDDGGGNDNQDGNAQGGSQPSDNGGGNDNQGGNAQGGSQPSDNGGGNDNQGDNSQGGSHASDNGGGNDNQDGNSQGGSHASDNGGGNDNQGDNSQGASHASDNSGGNDDQGDNSQGASHASDNGGGNDDQGDNSQGASHASDNGGGNDNQDGNAQGGSQASDNGGGNDNQGGNSQGGSHASDNGGGNAQGGNQGNNPPADNTQALNTPVDNAPVAGDGVASTKEDATLHGSVTATDTDGDSLTYSLIDGPQHGTVSFNSDGSYTYTPNADYNGTDGFTFKANDGHVDSNLGAVDLTITAVDDAPVITADNTVLDHYETLAGASTQSQTFSAQPHVQITDIDSTHMSTATIDTHGFQHGDTLHIGASSLFDVTVSQTGDDYHVSISAKSGSESTTDFQNFLNAISFDSTSSHDGVRSLDYTVTDDQHTVSNTAHGTVDIQSSYEVWASQLAPNQNSLGSGDDILHLDHKLTGLFDMGSGDDTVKYEVNNGTFNHQTAPNLQNVEHIDTTGYGTNTVSLSISDVLNMTDGDHFLTIVGDKSDTVNLTGDNSSHQWQQTGSHDGFNVYTWSDPTHAVTVEISQLMHQSTT